MHVHRLQPDRSTGPWRFLHSSPLAILIILMLFWAIGCDGGDVSSDPSADGDTVDITDTDEETDGDAVEDDIDDMGDKPEDIEDDTDPEGEEGIDGDDDEITEEEEPTAMAPPIMGTPFISAGGKVESPTYILQFGFSVPLAAGPSQSTGYRLHSGSLQPESK